MRPEDAKVVADFLLATLEHELTLTTGVFAAVPDDKLDYQPDPKSKSALGLLRHLALEDEWILNAVADGRFSPMPDDSNACGIMTANDAVARSAQRSVSGPPSDAPRRRHAGIATMSVILGRCDPVGRRLMREGLGLPARLPVT